ncbi:MAG: phage integrase SAM-like domain-containing protein [Candidatus Cryptobacteroides sp.]
MERITLYCRTTSARGTTNLRFRVTDGRSLTMYYSTGRKIPNDQLAAFTPEGTLRPRVTVYNPKLKTEIEEYFAAVNAAYNHMKVTRMDMRSDVLRVEVDKILNPESSEAVLHPNGQENLVQRLKRYIEEAYRNDIIGKNRYMHYSAMCRRMERFLCIKGHSNILPAQFDVKMLMDYHSFIADEYLYVPKYPKIYVKDGRKRYPKKRISNNSVVHEMKGLRAFFNELENTDEIFKSPFRKISHERIKTMMRMKKDEPFFLRKAEFKLVVDTQVPQELQMTKDIFVLNCCIGARIGDFMSFGMDRISVSPEGIPFIHYIPHKTMKIMENVTEIKTPLVRIAYDIVMRTNFNFNDRKANFSLSVYNRELRNLLKFCGIDRPVARFNEAKGDNEYFPLYDVASSRLARKTHIDMMNKVQVNAYVAGLHAEGSDAVYRYTNLEISDRFALMNVAFGQKAYCVNSDLTLMEKGSPESSPKERTAGESRTRKRKPGRPRK